MVFFMEFSTYVLKYCSKTLYSPKPRLLFDFDARKAVFNSMNEENSFPCTDQSCADAQTLPFAFLRLPFACRFSLLRHFLLYFTVVFCNITAAFDVRHFAKGYTPLATFEEHIEDGIVAENKESFPCEHRRGTR